MFVNRPGSQRKTVGGRIAAIFVLTVTAGWPLGAYAGVPKQYELADLKALQAAFVELAEDIRPSVVAIRTYRVSDPKNAGTRLVLRPHSQGSGFVIDSDGHVVTNRHVVEEANVISVILHNGLKYDATIVRADQRSDLAVLKIEVDNLKAIDFGDLSGVKVNQWVFACGNPFGLANDDGRTSVTYGVVSALGRQMTDRLVRNSDLQYYGNMIETSAAINPGSSGGPLFNLDGEVVGIVTAIETSSGVTEGHGFAIPVDKNTRRILDLLKAGEEVHYGFLGVLVQDVDPPQSTLVVDKRVYRGAELRSISLRDGPAARAGLKARDIIVEYDSMPIEDSDHLVRLVGFTPVGTEVPVTYLRSGVKRKTVVTVGDRQQMLSRADRNE